MTNQIPPDWVLLEGAKKCGWEKLYTLDTLQRRYANDLVYRSLCNMIAKHEQKPVDRKRLCARETTKVFGQQKFGLSGYIAADLLEDYVFHAIKLWEEGFGK